MNLNVIKGSADLQFDIKCEECKTSSTYLCNMKVELESLLHEIYRANASGRHSSLYDSAHTSDNTVIGALHVNLLPMVSNRSASNVGLRKKRLKAKDITELRSLKNNLNASLTSISSHLVKEVKKRDKNLLRRQKHCTVITAAIYAFYPALRRDTRVKFSVEPLSGDESGFAQWHGAMKLCARLPGGIPKEFRRRTGLKKPVIFFGESKRKYSNKFNLKKIAYISMWLTLAEYYISRRKIVWKDVEDYCFSEWSCPDDEQIGDQIIKDLHRTGCSLFCGSGAGDNQALLKRVLLGFARWNKSVGYCQGFNMLAALILEVMDKEESDALKVMIFLIEGVLPDSYFADNLRGLTADMAVMVELLHVYMPRLSAHLDALQSASEAMTGLNKYTEPPLTNVFTMQWFLAIYASFLPRDVVLRIYDLTFLQGNEIMIRTALVIWMKIAPCILKARSSDEFYGIMGDLRTEVLDKRFIDANDLIEEVIRIAPFPFPGLVELREKYTYNITPWSHSVANVAKKGLQILHLNDEVLHEGDHNHTDEQNLGSRSNLSSIFKRNSISRKSSSISENGGGPSGPTLEISTLKRQYEKLVDKQKQAQIVVTANDFRRKSLQEVQRLQQSNQLTMKHLLRGKKALVTKRKIETPIAFIPISSRILVERKNNELLSRDKKYANSTRGSISSTISWPAKHSNIKQRSFSRFSSSSSSAPQSVNSDFSGDNTTVRKYFECENVSVELEKKIKCDRLHPKFDIVGKWDPINSNSVTMDKNTVENFKVPRNDLPSQSLKKVTNILVDSSKTENNSENQMFQKKISNTKSSEILSQSELIKKEPNNNKSSENLKSEDVSNSSSTEFCDNSDENTYNNFYDNDSLNFDTDLEELNDIADESTKAVNDNSLYNESDISHFEDSSNITNSEFIQKNVRCSLINQKDHLDEISNNFENTVKTNDVDKYTNHDLNSDNIVDKVSDYHVPNRSKQTISNFVIDRNQVPDVSDRSDTKLKEDNNIVNSIFSNISSESFLNKKIEAKAFVVDNIIDKTQNAIENNFMNKENIVFENDSDILENIVNKNQSDYIGDFSVQNQTYNEDSIFVNNNGLKKRAEYICYTNNENGLTNLDLKDDISVNNNDPISHEDIFVKNNDPKNLEDGITVNNKDKVKESESKILNNMSSATKWKWSFSTIDNLDDEVENDVRIDKNIPVVLGSQNSMFSVVIADKDIALKSPIDDEILHQSVQCAEDRIENGLFAHLFEIGTKRSSMDYIPDKNNIIEDLISKYDDCDFIPNNTLKDDTNSTYKTLSKSQSDISDKVDSEKAEKKINKSSSYVSLLSNKNQEIETSQTKIENNGVCDFINITVTEVGNDICATSTKYGGLNLRKNSVNILNPIAENNSNVDEMSSKNNLRTEVFGNDFVNSEDLLDSLQEPVNVNVEKELIINKIIELEKHDIKVQNNDSKNSNIEKKSHPVIGYDCNSLNESTSQETKDLTYEKIAKYDVIEVKNVLDEGNKQSASTENKYFSKDEDHDEDAKEESEKIRRKLWAGVKSLSINDDLLILTNKQNISLPRHLDRKDKLDDASNENLNGSKQNIKCEKSFEENSDIAESKANNPISANRKNATSAALNLLRENTKIIDQVLNQRYEEFADDLHSDGYSPKKGNENFEYS